MWVASIIDYRTTHWAAAFHPGAYKSTTAAFIKHHQTIKLNKIKLFPNDLVVAWFTGEDGKELMRRFSPAKLALYKYIWDFVNDSDKALIRKHLKRCVEVREQFKKGLCSEDVRIWYMALVLGSADDV